MNKITGWWKALLVALAMMPVCMQAQQLAVAKYHIYHPEIMNPGYVQNVPLTQFFIGHQQRGLASFGWNTVTQFLDLKIKPLGRHRNFGLGFYANNDIEHTESRFGAGLSMGVKVVQGRDYDFSLGGSLGLINWGSNYGGVQVYDRSDNLLIRPSNFAELDAAIGMS
ncbi:MAG: type IX secretion system membrane protein PorP/SprF, partial [Bacteroidota bacterium]